MIDRHEIKFTVFKGHPHKLQLIYWSARCATDCIERHNYLLPVQRKFRTIAYFITKVELRKWVEYCCSSNTLASNVCQQISAIALRFMQFENHLACGEKTHKISHLYDFLFARIAVLIFFRNWFVFLYFGWLLIWFGANTFLVPYRLTRTI